MNTAPDWQDGECCYRCRTQFTLVARKHHCRNCGNIFCAKCSGQQIPLPKLNINKSVRVCDGCYDKILGSQETGGSTPTADHSSASTSGDKSKIKVNKSATDSVKSSRNSTSSNKQQATNASAPSEQELKEEEELQLALALSLSETPAKVSFPDFKQFEEQPEQKPNNRIAESPKKLTTSTSNGPKANSVSSLKSNHSSGMTSNAKTENFTPETTNHTIYPTPSTSLTHTEPEYNASVDVQSPIGGQLSNFSFDYQLSQADKELFRFTSEVHSTCDVFMNRVNSNKLRNRPIADDSAIQSLFLKLNTMHTKLLEQINIHDAERSKYETLQDKLTQIADARAALDALREEHQEKLRQEAAEAERQRQTQLASKLELMRQKKSQMMQYQREIAMQRIQAQEALLNQQHQVPQLPMGPQQSVGYVPPVIQAPQPQQPSSTVPSVQPMSAAPYHQITSPSMSHHSMQPANAMPHSQPNSAGVAPSQSTYHQVPMSTPASHQSDPQQIHQHLPPTTTQLPQTHMFHSQQSFVQQQSQQQHQTEPQAAPKPPVLSSQVEDEAPLISFDD